MSSIGTTITIRSGIRNSHRICLSLSTRNTLTMSMRGRTRISVAHNILFVMFIINSRIAIIRLSIRSITRSRVLTIRIRNRVVRRIGIVRRIRIRPIVISRSRGRSRIISVSGIVVLFA